VLALLAAPATVLDAALAALETELLALLAAALPAELAELNADDEEDCAEL
jgi:hypothetical protein